MDAQTPTRIVIVGKNGSGKSSLANTILRKDVFPISHAASSVETRCYSETHSVDGNLITLIESPGLIGTCGSEESIKPALIRCITECAPGPHAFLITLKVERYTSQEQEIIQKINQYFSQEVFKFATVVFTHGDQLPECTTIDEFVSQNEALRALVQKCGGRCHVVDNKYWKTAGQNEYRNNQHQVGRLLTTIDSVIRASNNGFYTNEMFQEVMKELEKEEDKLRATTEMRGISPQQIRTRARGSVFEALTVRLTGTAAGALMGAFLGVSTEMKLVISNFDLSRVSISSVLAAAQTGAMKGAMVGYEASGGATSPKEAMEKAWDALSK